MPLIGALNAPVLAAIRIVPPFSVMSNLPPGKAVIPHGLVRPELITVASYEVLVFTDLILVWPAKAGE
jgi:hypothetical protein